MWRREVTLQTGRAAFFPSGFEHPLTSHAGTALALSLWQGVQSAAADALDRLQNRLFWMRALSFLCSRLNDSVSLRSMAE